MTILLVCATYKEAEGFIKNFGLKKLSKQYLFHGEVVQNKVFLIITGIGTVFTAYLLTKVIYDLHPDIVINVGIAGSYNINILPGEIVKVVSDEFADIGFFNNYKFIKSDNNENNIFYPEFDFNSKTYDKLKPAKAITVNISHFWQKFLMSGNSILPDIETMEGAAVFMICNKERINCIQIRAISNNVGVFDKAKWDINDSLSNLNNIIFLIISEL
jgi:futalosine hydrolase